MFLDHLDDSHQVIGKRFVGAVMDFDDFDEDVLEQASAWVARLRSDQQSDSDQRDFALWLAESDQHRAAFDETIALWEAMSAQVTSQRGSTATRKPSSHNSDSKESADNRAYLGQVAATTIHSASNDCCQSPHSDSATLDSLNTADKAHLPNTQSVLNTSSSALLGESGARKSWRRIATLSVAASLLTIALSIFFYIEKPQDFDSTEIAQQLYATPIGKQQSFSLSDGSTIQLSTGSQVTVSFSENKRSLHLLKGEAYFEVSPDPKRPFVVHAGLGEITAIGTAFNIKRSENSVLVAVTHGVVAVADTQVSDQSHNANLQNNIKQDQVKVTVGKKVSVDNKSGIGAIENADIEKITAWRANTLIFKDTLLVEALAELNRYLIQPIDLSDQSLQALRISGTFNVGDPNTTFDAIVTSFQLESYNSPITNKTRLYRRTL